MKKVKKVKEVKEVKEVDRAAAMSRYTWRDPEEGLCSHWDRGQGQAESGESWFSHHPQCHRSSEGVGEVGAEPGRCEHPAEEVIGSGKEAVKPGQDMTWTFGILRGTFLFSVVFSSEG